MAATACGASPVKARLATVDAQRWVMLVVDTTGSQPRTTTVVTDLAAPYRARTMTYEGASAQGPSLGGFAWDDSGVYTISPDGSAHQTEYIAAGFPGPASHLTVSLPVALRQRLVHRLGLGRSADRPCERWLSQFPLDGAPLSAPRAMDRTESCVDPNGRVLTESWVVAGKQVRTRTLTDVRPGPNLLGLDLFDQREPRRLPTKGSAYVVRAASPDELAGLLQVPVPPGPVGLTADRSSAVLTVDAQRQAFSREAAVLTWTVGGQLAVLRIERDLQHGAARTTQGEPIDLGAMGTGQLEPVLAGLRMTVSGPRGLTMVATADLSEPAFVTWLRSLRFA